ncbi:MAG: hypothetical protein J6Q65_06115, partial [Lentisphaeria bacterium]|nr:hypothetical protein [Lentisphaeria bacterium]
YDGADHTVTVKVVVGGMVIDTIDVELTYTFGGTTVDAMHNAGTYTVTVDVGALKAALGTEYVLSTTAVSEQTVEVQKATLTVTAAAKSITVGGDEPPLTYTVDGLKNGDAFTGTLVRAEGTNPGVYAITLADGYTITNGETDVSANYDFSFVGANLTIKEAASLTVTTLDDVVDATDGKVSFREAWLAANNKTSSLAVDGVYTISFDQSLTANYDSDGDTTADSYRIALDSTLGTLSSASIKLVVDGSIGTNRVILDGQGAFKMMDLRYGTITIQDFVITGAKEKSTSGGVMTANGTITIRNVLFTGNNAGNGGAVIYTSGGTVNIYDSEFTNNTANNGGVFYQGGGTLNVYNSVFTGNTGTSASVYRSHGGGAATFVNSVFYGNNSGPAFELAGGSTMTLIDCIVADNGDANDSQIKMNKAGSVMNLINTVVLKGTDNTADAIQISSGTVNLYYSVTDKDYSGVANFNVTGGINNATFADTLEVVNGLPQVIASSNAGKNGVLVGRDAAGNYY